MDAGVIHDDVEPAEVADDGRDQSIDGTRIRDVGSLNHDLVGRQALGHLFE
jgi:hypothetical protein